MDTHTYANVKLLLSPRQSRGITYWIYKIYAESFQGVDHLRRLLEEVQTIVNDAACGRGVAGTWFEERK